jgi:hypothetical protein
MPKPPRMLAVYLVVILPIFTIGGALFIAAFIAMYAMAAGVPLRSISRTTAVLIGWNVLLPWIPLSFLLANWVLFFVPSLRRVADKYIAESGSPGFKEAQKRLGIATAVMAAFSLAFILLDFV